MERTLQVLDCAVLIISGPSGIQSHTVTLWRLLAEIPLVAPEAVPARTFPELWAEFLKSICLSA